MLNHYSIACYILLASAGLALAQSEKDLKPNPLVTALAFSHQYANPKSLTPDRDKSLKTTLITAMSKKQELSWDTVKEIFDRVEFQKLGEGKPMTVETMNKLVQAGVPESRKAMNDKTRQHAELLSTQFDMIDASHYEAGSQLVEWIVKNYRSDQPLGIMIICTGNTRRSLLGSTMGNLASAYHGMPNIRFYSGGTAPIAFNPRTIATLRDIGVVIEPTGKEATRGPSNEPNPIYAVRWGKNLETIEFSKQYTDAGNPQKDFAALLVCSEADESCPKVRGASIRIPVPYIDPKAYDGSTIESAKYAERRDDIGRFMLNVLLRSQRQLKADGKLKN